MPKSNMYVLQVIGGQEDRACTLIRSILPSSVCSEVFVPRYRKRVRRKGIWRSEEVLLTPGYLYLTTMDVNRTNLLLQIVPTFTRVVRSTGKILPLDADEVDLINALTQPNQRTVKRSCGFIEGDKIVVTSGPLVGRESYIAKINRHKRLAYLEFHLLGRNKLITVGLEIVRKL